MANTGLSAAKKGKNDEFYTQWPDIEKEVNAYIEFNPNVFRGKTILLPADDPFESNFFKYFATKFNEFGIKKLISTSYAPSPIVNTQISLLPDLIPEEEIGMPMKIKVAYKIELTEVLDETGNGTVNIDDVIARLIKEKEVIDSGGMSNILSYLNGDEMPDGISKYGAGDFRSQEVTALRNEADMIITNPPFSLFREFMAWIKPDEKQFSIIGNMNSVTYREVFPLIQENKVWYGPSISSGDREFMIPDNYPLKSSGWRIDDDGNKYIRVKGVRWFTNIDHGRRHQPLGLMTMADNAKYNSSKKFQATLIDGKYPVYDNYPAIEVPETKAIPSDYLGVMGVPITFLDKYNPEQFNILGLSRYLKTDGMTKEFVKKYYESGQTGTIKEGHPDLGYYDKNGIPVVTYMRVMIQRHNIDDN